MSTPLVAVDNLVVEYVTDRFTVRALDGFTMHASAGQLVALLGPSGSGKTTLLSILSGMAAATSGTVVVNDIDVLTLAGKKLEEYRRKTIGIVFQGFNLIPSLNARENVAAPLLVAGANRKAALMRADELLDEVGVGDRRNHKPIYLSGGQQQRVAIARGLIGEPLVLLADEPTANLDHESAQSVVDLLGRLRERGRTVIISTHDDRLLSAVDQLVQIHPDFETPHNMIKEVSVVHGDGLARRARPGYAESGTEGMVDIREISDGRKAHR